MYRSRLFTAVTFAGVLASGTAALSTCSPGIDPATLPTTTTTTVAPVCVSGNPVGSVELVSVTGLDPCLGSSQYTGFFPSSALSADGRYVAFISGSGSLVDGDTNGRDDVFVRDRQTGVVERVSVTTAGVQAPPATSAWNVWDVAMSADGRYVTFTSKSALVPGAVAGANYSYLHDRQTGTTEMISIAPDGSMVANPGPGATASVSDDGRYVAFQPSSMSGIYVRDRVAGTTTVAVTGAASSAQTYRPWLSGNGRYLAFVSDDPNLVADDPYGCFGTFVKDLTTQTIDRVDVTSSGDIAQSEPVDPLDPDHACGAWGSVPSISDDGRYVAFSSDAWNLYGLTTPVRGSDLGSHVYVRDRTANTTTRADGLGLSVAPLSAMRQSISDSGRYVSYMCHNCTPNGPGSGVMVTDMTTGQTQLITGRPPNVAATDGFYMEEYSNNMSADGHYLTFDFNPAAGGAFDTYLEHIN